MTDGTERSWGEPPELPVAPVGAEEVRVAAREAAAARGALLAQRGLPLGRPFGVPLRISVVSVVAYIFAATLTLGSGHEAAGLSENAVAALSVAGGLLLLVSVLVHELAHAVLARRLGLRVDGIRLGFLGGMTAIESADSSPRREAAVALAGPLTSVVVATGCAAGYLLSVGDGADWLGFRGPHDLAAPLLAWLAWSNALLAAFNLIPGLPLDGGRVLRAAVWRMTGHEATGTRVAALVGYALAMALVAASWTLDLRDPGGLWLAGVAVAAYIAVSSSAALQGAGVRERTPALSAGQLARRAVLATSDLPLAEALRRATAAGATAVVSTERDGRPAGIMNGRAVDAMPLQRRPWVPLASVTRPLARGLVLEAGLTGESVLDALRATPASEYLVVDPAGAVVGVLSTVDVAALLDPRSRVVPSAVR
ncbi:MAG TPA: M50 family metallopeptidase [Mycobacteriales bacterium]|nr:M50 family metallopeptidase [Mycobacteriales bacterium]